MSATRPLRAVVVVSSILALFVACSLGNVDFANKACPCGSGYVCDSARNVCVLPADLDGAAPAPDAADDRADTGSSCAGDRCPCAVDGDCKESDRAHCSTGKVCVECTASDQCHAGTYCNAANQCVLGCKQESDCQISPAAPHCDMTRHQCVACRSITDCSGGDQCSPSGQCVVGCNLDAGQLCPVGKQCCQGLCIDTKQDLLNCGACGVACSTQNGTPTCASSACSWACASGYAHCGTTNSGCETNLRTDVSNCNACGRDCKVLTVNATGITCTLGTCDYQSCTASHDDCDGVRENGCECACGLKKNDACCAGNVCSAPLTCNAAAKCI